MKRDFDVIRKILLDVEEAKDLEGVYAPKIENVEEEVVKYHLLLMRDAGLIDGIEVSTLGDGFNLRRINMTWAGHDFLDSARNDTVWKKTQKTIKESIGSVSLDVLKSLLRKEALQFLGMDS